MSIIKYLLDEHVPVQLLSALLRESTTVEAFAVGQEEVPPKGTLDPELLIWAEKYGFSLVTEDRTTMRVYAADHVKKGGKTWGLFIIRKGYSLGQIAESLAIVWGASQAEEWENQEIFVPLS